MKRLPLALMVSLGFAAVAGFVVVPQDDDGEWTDEGTETWIGDLHRAADSARADNNEDCARVLEDAAAGYGFANGGVFNDNDLYNDTDAYGHTEHRGQTTTIWIDHEA